MDIEQQIEQSLVDIEQKYNVTILFACESGSRAWGVESPDSDYDVRFIYVHRLDWYLNVSPQRDVIELPINDVLDINGWELRKALGLLKKGNATLVEWLSSPIIYHWKSYFFHRMEQEAIPQTYQSERSFYHYLHMAQRNYRQYLQGDKVRFKKYLYVLRPIFAAQWVEQKRKKPPIKFSILLDQIMPENTPLRQVIDDLVVQKKQVLESEYTPKIEPLNVFIEQELARLAEVVIESTIPDFMILDEILYDMVTRFQDISQKDVSVIPKGEFCYQLENIDGQDRKSVV